MRIDEDKDYKLEWRKAMDELVNLRQEYRELKEDKDYIKSLLDVEFKKGLNLKKENEQLKADAKVVLLILQAIDKLPFKISVSEAKAIKRLSENVGELLE